jgi:hypothetical protein
LEYRAEIGSLVEVLGLRSIQDSSRNKYYKVTSSLLNHWLLSECYTKETAKHNAGAKRIPDFVFHSTDAMSAFLASVYKGDGDKRQVRYSTVSLELAKGMVVLLSYLGLRAKLTYEVGSRIYRVVFKNTSSKLTYSGSEKHKRLKVLPFDGMVYCVTTERNHTVIAGRNGMFVPVGQSYGVMGFETFALYCLPVADATAALGRDAITRTIEKCKQEEVSVIYSDTDSLFIENPNKEKIADVLKWADKELGVELEVDKTYRYVAFSQLKKNYFGVLQDGTADIKGLTGKKSQTPEFLKNQFYEMLDILGAVYSQADFDQAKARIKRLLTDMVTRLRDRKVPLDDLSFNVMMGKSIGGYKSTRTPEAPKKEAQRRGAQASLRDGPQEPQEPGISAAEMSGLPQHVKAAILLRNSNKEVKAGEQISFVKTKGGHGVKPTSQAKPEDIDVDKYIEYASSMFDQVLSALDLSFESVVPKTSLDAFWA